MRVEDIEIFSLKDIEDFKGDCDYAVYCETIKLQKEFHDFMRKKYDINISLDHHTSRGQTCVYSDHSYSSLMFADDQNYTIRRFIGFHDNLLTLKILEGDK